MRPKVKLYYFFIWGNHPSLALAEVLSAFNRWGIACKLIRSSVEAAVVELEQFLPDIFINQLGGTVKIGQIIEAVSKEKITPEYLSLYLTSKQAKRIVYGLSQYRLDNFVRPLSQKSVTTLGRETKKILKNTHQARWVVSKEKNLSSVVVKKNKLIQTGTELILLYEAKKIWLGKTTAVQPFEEYSNRDYGRPYVNPKVGMLPPKLAQSMLNLSERNPREIILDPFCGFGTVLQEALLMGWHHVVGADISHDSINASKKNLNWLKKRYGLRNSIVRLFLADARSLSPHLRGSYISAIITEPLLGPPLSKKLSKQKALKIKNELEALYLLSFIDYKNYLKPRGRVVMVWPVFIMSDSLSGLVYIDIIDKLKEHGFCLARPHHEELYKFKVKGYTPRDTFIYGRPKQKIWREIVIFDYLPKKGHADKK